MSRQWLRPGLYEHLLLVLLLVAAAVSTAHQGWLWRWDNLIYDSHLRFWSRPAPEDVVIVAIDEASLAALGRWPWSRRVHARLIDRLSAEGAGVVAPDIIFAEPDAQDPGADQALVEAIAANGRTVLPVIVEQPRLGGQLLETLPLPALAEAAARLGHVHFELDRDSIARRTFLAEGLGSPRWPAFALAMLEVAGVEAPAARATLADPPASAATANLWVRRQQLLLPFAGPPGHFQRISYWRVLDGDYPAGLFRDKFVMIGMTATGLGDILPTPVSAQEQPMPGVELNANLFDALRLGLVIEPLPMALQLALVALAAALPMLLYPRLAPSAALLATVVALAATFALSSALLLFARLWFAPASALLVLLASYPLWSWRRLDNAVRYLQQELQRLSAEQANLPSVATPQLGVAMRFLQQLLPIAGWSLSDTSGRCRESHGEPPPAPRPAAPSGQWRHHGNYWWSEVRIEGRAYQLCLNWRGEPPGRAQRRFLDSVLGKYSGPVQRRPRGTVELIEARIREVQAATERLRDARKVIDDSLARMADGTLVLSALGQVVFCNPQAAALLLMPGQSATVGAAFADLLGRGAIADKQRWLEAARRALLDARPTQFEVQSERDRRSLLVQFAPLGGPEQSPLGVVVNLSDVSALKESERRRAEALGFLSHDLRSPLVSLMAVLELADQQGEAAARGKLLARAKGYTERTLDLAEQFVELARVEGSEGVSFDGVDLVAVATNAYELVWDQARKKEIDLSTRFELEEAWLTGDARMIERALVNLLANAIKYSPPGSKVALELQLRGLDIVASVSDDGPGIAAEELPALFDRFRRGSGGRRSGESGAGLGLALVGAVAERHGGRVEARSEPGKGSAFSLILPLTDPPGTAG